ncbi:hypothetical protein PMI16_05032 [Herbaspirillum sp. CF444]|uniref:hypothetical protein n=1 Tax=Herbaspirillum sp. CF444 TaxID=1144319 RepID=UPI00027263EA|nr:hypothetical protein [Herbaspirillum sp. CF444]EJL80717.1 hypothetical protein PMI16_05032 [Herbaspirillum sp. CF444]
MRITKLETKLDTFFNGNYFLNNTSSPAAPQRLPYEVIASCRCNEAQRIEELILLQLQDGFDQGYELEITPRAHLQLVDYTISLACSTAERAALVRLVSRLGLEKSIRSVRWQSVPGARG